MADITRSPDTGRISIPAAALEAMRAALAKGKPVREVAIAMLKAWPGMLDMTEGEPGRESREIILPLPPQEKTND